VRDSAAYLDSKEEIAISRALEQSVAAYDEEDAKRREAYAQRVPPEPAEGGAGVCKLCVHVGAASSWRRFDADATLEDVLNYVRSLPGCPAVRDAAQLRLVDCTTRPAKPLDPSTQLGLTLKSMGLWPSGQVRCRVDGPDEAFDDATQGLVRLPSEDRA